MSTPRGYRNGLRVRVGDRGERGVLLFRLPSITTPTWLVRMDDGSWRAPVDLIVDGTGSTVQPACEECGLPFVSVPGAVVCEPCAIDLCGRR